MGINPSNDLKNQDIRLHTDQNANTALTWTAWTDDSKKVKVHVTIQDVTAQEGGSKIFDKKVTGLAPSSKDQIHHEIDYKWPFFGVFDVLVQTEDEDGVKGIETPIQVAVHRPGERVPQ